MIAPLPTLRNWLKRPRNVFGVMLSLALLALLTVGVLWNSVSFSPADLELPDDLIFLDREGRTLRHLPDAHGERHLWTPLDSVPKDLQNAFIAAEDRRFYSHHGFDLKATGRALISNIRSRRVVSGASTITQQLMKRVYPQERNFSAKVTETIRAIKTERKFSKNQILEHYLNRVPMGNNLIGVGLASQVYFSKNVDDLSVAECAFLASLPKAPGSMNPYGKGLERLRQRRNWVLKRMKTLGYLSEEQYSKALTETISTVAKRFPSEAPHFVDMLLDKIEPVQPPRKGIQRTSLDLDLQNDVESVLQSHQTFLRQNSATQACALIVENTGEDALQVRAWIGSTKYSAENGGFNDGVRAMRSPGSTLKPFLFALALDSGYTASSLLEDVEAGYRTPGGEYLPRNFNRKQYGPVTVRAALASSLNLSAVQMLRNLTYPVFYDFLDRIGLVKDPSKGADQYGLGLVIGNMEVSLEDLVRAYTTLANAGNLLSYYDADGPAVSPGKAALSPQAAFIITDILSDPAARSLTFGSLLDLPFPIAWKTGTSTKYRDCWIVGYTPEYTIGVWVGNFDGRPTANLSGVTAAGPIFADLVHLLYSGSTSAAESRQHEPPDGLEQARVCGYSGMRPTSHCVQTRNEWFKTGTAPTAACSFHQGAEEGHEIGAPYANWLFEHTRLGQTSPYRLSGFGETPQELFSDAQEDQPILRGAITARSPSALSFSPPKPKFSPVNSGHVSIGPKSSVIPQSDRSGRQFVQITSPLNGDCFVVEPGTQARTLSLRARLQAPARTVTWYIDGIQFAETGPPYSAEWPLAPGRHRIEVVTPQNVGDAVTIKVE